MVDSFATSHAPWSFAVVKYKNNNQMRETSHHHHHHYHITFYWDQSRKYCEWKIKQTAAKMNLRRLHYELKLFTPQTDLCRTDLRCENGPWDTYRNVGHAVCSQSGSGDYQFAQLRKSTRAFCIADLTV